MRLIHNNIQYLKKLRRKRADRKCGNDKCRGDRKKKHLTGWRRKGREKDQMRHKTMRQTKCSTDQAERNYTVEAEESFLNESAELKVSQGNNIIV